MDVQQTFPIHFTKVVSAELGISDLSAVFFCDKFRHIIPEDLKLVLANGDEIAVKYISVDCVLSGMKELYSKFPTFSSVFVVFEYYGGSIFRIDVLDGTSGTQFDKDLVEEVGVKFIKIFLSPYITWKPLTAPKKFITNFGRRIPASLCFRLPSGQIFEGSYDNNNGTFTGLQNVLRLTDLSPFEMLILTYCGDGLFDVCGFGKNAMAKEICYYDVGEAGKFFEIEVHESHLMEFSFGVKIPRKFCKITDSWSECDTIVVQYRESCWVFNVKKRQRRTEIHKPWPVFWKELQLQAGDICVFKRSSSCRHFNLQVYRKSL